ncbi:MAG: type II toxin-antitoxin system RelE/ParE family toxin [Marinifilaceae bacterium]|jgi:proteic killer suppression protein|nr:type II toxin-antitoxin system RelE/ParE family toxin [Marinifilaceae bacterium]
MKIVFENDYLEQLYTDGKAKGKKYRYPEGVVKKYKQTIDKLRVANRVEDLFPFKSLNYEKLIGDKKGLESVRVNQQYRVEFRSSVEGEEPNTVTICSIVELSNHYK